MRKIETLSTGRYKVRFRHAGKQTSESFDTRKEAERFALWLDALGPQGALDQLYNGEQASTVPTLDTIAREHIEHIDGGGAGHKLKSQRLWERTWGPRIGMVRADQVSRDMLIRALSDLATNGRAPGRGYSEKSLYNQRGLLYGVLGRCVDEGYLTKHPGVKLKLPQVTVSLDLDNEDDPAEMVCLDFAEFETLLANVAPHYQPFVRHQFGLGTRWGEAVVLRVKDFNLRGPVPTVRIRRALKWSPDGNHVIGPPKTKKGRRTLTLPREVAEDVARLVQGKADNDLVFTTPGGKMMQHRTFWSDHWRPAIFRAQHCAEHTHPDCRCGTAHPKRCKVHDAPPPPCRCPGTLQATPRIHDMRHTHASWLLAGGVQIHVVQHRLGHESGQTTIDTYTHLLPDAQLLAASAAQLAFAPRAELARPPHLELT